MLQSVNIQLPDNIVLILDELPENGDSSEDKLSQRSTLITLALQHYSQFLQKTNYAIGLKQGPSIMLNAIDNFLRRGLRWKMNYVTT